MAKAKISRSRKRVLEEPDEFISFSARLIQWVRKHRLPLSFGAGFIVILSASIFVGRYFSDKAENRASDLMAKTMAKYETILKDQPPDKAYLDAKIGFEQILEQYSGKDAAKIAKVIYADIAYDAGDFEKAIELYNKASADFDKDPFFKNLIFSSLGYSYEGKKDYKTAAKYFEMVVSGPDSGMIDEALFNLGRIYAAMGKMEKSKDMFQKIISDQADSIYIDLVKEKVAG
jgi:tetratricopeptide (TPR) repeat protein